MGDFNYPKLAWEETQPILKQKFQNHEIYQDFVPTLDDNYITQRVSEPTRENNILGLFLTGSPTLILSLGVVPGISDYQAVFAVVKLRPTVQKIKHRTVQLYSKADWDGMKHETLEFRAIYSSQPVNVKAMNNFGRCLRVR